MIYAFIGTDRQEAHAKAEALVAKLHQKKPDAEIFHLEQEQWNSDNALRFSASQGLFEKKFIVVIKDVFARAETLEVFFDHADALKESESIFIVVDGELSAAHIKKLEKFAEKVQTIEESKNDQQKAPQQENNIFALTDALGAGNTLRAWNLYNEARAHGSEPEQLHGILWWYVKNLMLTLSSASAAEAKINPYVFSKAQAAAKKLGAYNVRKYADSLVSMYHNSRKGETDLGLEVEKFIVGWGK